MTDQSLRDALEKLCDRYDRIAEEVSIRGGVKATYDIPGSEIRHLLAAQAVEPAIRCNCGFGGVHDDANPRCDLNQAHPEPAKGVDCPSCFILRKASPGRGCATPELHPAAGPDTTERVQPFGLGVSDEAREVRNRAVDVIQDNLDGPAYDGGPGRINVAKIVRALSDAGLLLGTRPQPTLQCTCDPGPEGQHRYWCATYGPHNCTAHRVTALDGEGQSMGYTHCGICGEPDVDRPQPALDREAVGEIIRDSLLTYEQAVSRIMALVRPLPTREQIEAAIRKRLVESNFNDNLHEPIRTQTIDQWADVLAGAVVLLFTGGEV